MLLTRLSPVTPYTVDPGLRGVSAQPDSEGAALEAELAVERMKREAAERLATERLDRVEDLRVALRAIGPGPTVLVKRHWWSRRGGLDGTKALVAKWADRRLSPSN